MATESVQIQNVFTGAVHQNIPKTPVNEVKLIVISNPQEFDGERECIWNEILPDIQQYCLQHAAEVLLLDPGVGSSEDLALNSKDFCLVVDEINRCRQTSTAVFFMCLVGERYGLGPLPDEIKTEEFNHIKGAALNEGCDVKIFDEFYKIDYNAVPPVYKLQSQSGKGKQLSPTQFANVQDAIRKGAKAAHDEGLINQVSQKRQERFFNSVIEQCGKIALSKKDSMQNCLFVLRKLEIDSNSKRESDASCLNLNEKSVEERIENFKNFLSSTLDKPNIETFIVPLNKEITIWGQTKEQQAYLELFSPHVTYKLKQLIDRAFTARKLPKFDDSLRRRLYDEALLHLNYCIHQKCPNLIDRKEILENLSQHFHSSASSATSKPLCIRGEEGTGKTAILCEIAHQASAWLGTEPVIITRFLNVTPSIGLANELLLSICAQIAVSYELDIAPCKQLLTCDKLAAWFSQMLETVGKQKPPLVILLDDLHLLKTGHFTGGAELNWMPASLPANVIIVVTYAAEHQLKSKKFSILEVPQLSDQSLWEISKAHLARQLRALTSEQQRYIQQQLKQTPNPTVAMVLADYASQWPSNRSVSSQNGPQNVIIGNSLVTVCEEHLSTCERRFGKEVIIAICSYLECTMHGLTEGELLDLLTINKEKFHLEIADYFCISSAEIEPNTVTNQKAGNRLIMPQPLKFVAGELQVINVRRIRELWFHALQSGNIDFLKEQALCNFEYLEALLRSCGLAHLIAIFECAMFQVLHHDLHLFFNNILRASLTSLIKDPTVFAAEVIGRLRHSRSSNSRSLNQMAEQAMTWVDNYQIAPILVPLTTWIKPPKYPVALTFQLQDWSPSITVLQPTLNYQHILVSGQKDSGVIRMYHLASQRLVKSFQAHSSRVTTIVLSHNGQSFASGSVDKTVKTWDLIQGNCMRNMAMLVTGSADFNVRVFDVDSGNQISIISGLMAPVITISLTSNDTFLMVACEDETLKVFALCTAQEIHELRGHEGKVCSMGSSNDDCQLFAGCSDGTLYCYDIHNAELLETTPVHPQVPVSCVKVSSDSYYLFTAAADQIHVWNTEPRRFGRGHHGEHPEAEEMRYITITYISKDAKFCAVGNYIGHVELWELDTVQILWRARHDPAQRITALQFFPDMMHLVSGTDQGMICIWSMSTGMFIKSFQAHHSAILSIQVYSDGSRVMSLDSRENLLIWPAHGEFTVDELVVFKGAKEWAFLAPNDYDVICRTPDNDKEARIIRILENGSNSIRSKLPQGDTITCMGLSRDCRLVVTGSKDALKAWDATSGFITQVLVGHAAAVMCCAVGAEGGRILSGDASGTVIAWDLETGNAIYSFPEHSKEVTCVAITMDGSVGLSGSRDGWIYAWGLGKGVRLASFQAHIPIVQLHCSWDATRIVAQPERSSHLPILCLHNTPAVLVAVDPKKSKRQGSISSTGSSVSLGSAMSGHQPVCHERESAISLHSKVRPFPPPMVRKDSQKVFAHLERSRSRMSITENPTSVTKVNISGDKPSGHTGNSGQKSTDSPPTNTSSVCNLL